MMGSQLIAKVLAFFSAVGVGVAAVVLFTSAGGQTDRCFGFGTLLDETTDIEGRSIAACKAGPGRYIVVDSEGHVVADDFLIDEARQYYEEHPEDLPPSGPETFQDLFAVPEVPAEVLAAATEGCRADWVVTENETAQARFCHPPDWHISLEEATGIIVNDQPVSVGIVAPAESVSVVTGCMGAKAVTLETAGGAAKLCARRPEYWGQQWGLVLPSGRQVILALYNEATPSDVAAAVLVAASVETIP